MTLTFFVKQPKFNNQGLDALFENLSLILQNRDLILSTPEYRNIYISGMGVYPLYTPPLKLFLGDLLVLWEKTTWKQGDEYIYYVTGSPLSGRNCCHLYKEGEGLTSKNNSSMMALMAPAFLLAQTGSPERQTKCIPAECPPRTPSSLSIFDLINILNNSNQKQKQLLV